MRARQKSKKKNWLLYIHGFSLIEIIIYTALIALVSIFVINSLIRVVDAYNHARAEGEVITNARGILDTVTETIAFSQEAYVPTSRFNVDLGQLSLISPAATTTGHTTSYIDFYIDGGRLWRRQEGQMAEALSAASVMVSRFRLEHIIQKFGREAVRITLTVDYSNKKFPRTITLQTSATMRGNY